MTAPAGPITDRAYATLIAASFARFAEADPDAAGRLKADPRSRVSLGLAFAECVRRGMVRGVTADGRALLALTFHYMNDLLEGTAR